MGKRKFIRTILKKSRRTKYYENVSMKSGFFSMLLVVASLLIFSSCNSENEDSFEVEKALIYGSWSTTTVQEGEYVTLNMEIIWTFSPNNVASQQVIAKLNGTIFENVKNSYSYVYNSNKTITFTNEKNQTWTYEVKVNGKHMTLGNSEAGYFELTKK